MSKIKLFCFPYAGSTSMIYKKWRKYLVPDIELCLIELAGRGNRYSVPLYENMHEAVEDVFKLMKDDLDNLPFAMFGYSMGSLLTYELAYKVKQCTGRTPVHIFFAAKSAPDKTEDKCIHTMPSDKFKEAVLQHGGTPPALFENDELMEYFLPILRSDFKIVETYRYMPREDQLDCDISVLKGNQDKICQIEPTEWMNYTKGQQQLYCFDGGHFFIHDNVKKITGIVNNTLSKYL